MIHNTYYNSYYDYYNYYDHYNDCNYYNYYDHLWPAAGRGAVDILVFLAQYRHSMYSIIEF